MNIKQLITNSSFLKGGSRFLVAALITGAFIFASPLVASTAQAFTLGPNSDPSVVSVGSTQVQMTVTQEWNKDDIYTAVYSFKKVSADSPSNINLYIDVIKNGCLGGMVIQLICLKDVITSSYSR